MPEYLVNLTLSRVDGISPEGAVMELMEDIVESYSKRGPYPELVDRNVVELTTAKWVDGSLTCECGSNDWTELQLSSHWWTTIENENHELALQGFEWGEDSTWQHFRCEGCHKAIDSVPDSDEGDVDVSYH